MKTLALLFLLHTGSFKTIYENKVYKIECLATYVNGEVYEYKIYGQDSQYKYLVKMLDLYSGTDPVGFMDEVIEFTSSAKAGDFKKIRELTVRKEKIGFYLVVNKGYKGFSDKVWQKMRDKIDKEINGVN